MKSTVLKSTKGPLVGTRALCLLLVVLVCVHPGRLSAREPARCTFGDLGVSVDVPEGYSQIPTDCPQVAYKTLLDEKHALGFWVAKAPGSISLEYDEVQKILDTTIQVTELKFDAKHKERVLDIARVDNDADYPKSMIQGHGKCGELALEFQMDNVRDKGIERSRTLFCVAELPPAGSKRWTIVTVQMFEMNLDPAHIEPVADFEQISSDVFRSLHFNEGG